MSSLEELLSLFDLSIPFNSNDLKIARKKVLMLHPDKNINQPNIKTYYEKYKNAYEKLCVIYKFISHEAKREEHDNDETFKDYIEKHNIHKDPKKFSKHFNHMFEKIYVQSEKEKDGYGQWLTSSDDLYDKDNLEKSRKQLLQNQMIKKNEHLDTFDLKQTSYSDLKEAHINSIIGIDADEELKSKIQFKSVQQYEQYRHEQRGHVKNEHESKEMLQQQYKKDTLDSLQLAYEYKKQEDEFKKNQQNYNSRYLRLKNNL